MVRKWLFIILTVVCQITSAEKSFEDIIKEGKSKSEDYQNFSSLKPVVGDIDKTCIFEQKTSPTGELPRGAKLFSVEDAEDMLKVCKGLKDDECKGGVVLSGHAHYNMGTWNLLYLDSTSTKDNIKFYPDSKKLRDEIVGCFKRVSKGVRENKIPLTFASCTVPYPTNPKHWDWLSHTLAKEIGLTIRTSRGSNYSSYPNYAVAEFGWSWSTPHDKQVYCEDGKCWRWKNESAHE